MAGLHPWTARRHDQQFDWETAQLPAAWCTAYSARPPTNLSFSQTSDGYNVAAVQYFTGGEMMLVDSNLFLYDPVTGQFVAELWVSLFMVGCWVGTPNGPSNPAIDTNAFYSFAGISLKPYCESTQHDGSAPGLER